MEAKVKIYPPWPEHVEALNKFQKNGKWHPFTCPREHFASEVLLEATPEGWECESPVCDYTQQWAWEFMLDPVEEAR